MCRILNGENSQSRLICFFKDKFCYQFSEDPVFNVETYLRTKTTGTNLVGVCIMNNITKSLNTDNNKCNGCTGFRLTFLWILAVGLGY